MVKIIPLLFLIIGVFLIGQVSLPFISYKVWERALTKNSLPLKSPMNTSVLGISIQNTEGNFPQIYSNSTREGTVPYSYFTISVPSINIKDELVYVDSNDLLQGLAHLPGSALPGEKGNMFISGHSAIPLFAKKNNVVFAMLPNVKNGDIITVSVLGNKFRYKVTNIKVVNPDDVSVISPPDTTNRYISLMTCVPPGLNTKRLVVIGKLI